MKTRLTNFTLVKIVKFTVFPPSSDKYREVGHKCKAKVVAYGSQVVAHERLDHKEPSFESYEPVTDFNIQSVLYISDHREPTL